MAVLPSTPIPAGWYPDPAGSFQQRWWNGTSWTNDFAQYRPTLIHSAPLAEALQSGGDKPAFGEFATKQAASASKTVGGTSTGSTSTLTRTPRSGGDAALGLPPEDQAPLTTVARPNAGNAVLIPVVPLSAAPVAPERNTDWERYQTATPATPATPAATRATEPPQLRRSAQVRGRRYTLAGWLLALLPAIFLGIATAVAMYLPTFYTTVAQLSLGAAFLLVGVALAALDRRVLVAHDHDFTASPVWGLLTPLSYLSVRSVTVSRETGRAAYAPLILLLVTIAAVGASLAFVPGLIALLTAHALY